MLAARFDLGECHAASNLAANEHAKFSDVVRIIKHMHPPMTVWTQCCRVLNCISASSCKPLNMVGFKVWAPLAIGEGGDLLKKFALALCTALRNGLNLHPIVLNQSLTSGILIQ